ncbi:unnamed protein product [Amoebophrya sp. A120]|nr:unnamed protein product [Amoebophrya sp. A120]CAD7976387.1 unnamed protein product [Amoebophrya sp. A120]|eukprot:GSA120T00026358001.1
MLNHDFLFYGMNLPDGALQCVPGGKLTREFNYPDLEQRKSLGNGGAIAPEVSINSPTNAL